MNTSVEQSQVEQVEVEQEHVEQEQVEEIKSESPEQVEEPKSESPEQVNSTQQVNSTPAVSKGVKFSDLVQNLYKALPRDPFAYRLEFLTNLQGEDLKRLLAYFLVTGAKNLYNKKIIDLTLVELAYLKRYLLSIGWDMKYNLETRLQQDEKDSTKKTPVNYFVMDFNPADPALKITA